jgi:hypothetical protein
MKIRWTMFAIMFAVAALAVPQAGGRVGSRAQAAAAVAGELIDAGFLARQDDQDKDKDKHGRDHDKSYSDDSEFTEKDEFRQSYTLAAGATVRLSGINGAVDVETASGNTAEVHVVRSARNKSDLDYHKIIVEQTGSGLVVRGEKEKNESGRDRDGNNRQVRQRVTMRIPRSVEFTASGINGRATVGEIEGPVHLSGINGRVDVAQARGYTNISGINGSVTMLITQLTERGIRVSGVNGSVSLKFGEALNADLAVSGINGAVHTDGLPNVTVQGRISRQNFNARIGAGGAPINVSGVNGSVRLAPRS